MIACALVCTARGAAAEPAISAVLEVGSDQDLTAIGRVKAGGLYGLGKLAIEGHVSFEGFLRMDGDRGIAGRSLTPIDLGVRYALRGDHFIGPYVSGGASYGFFTGSPRERKVVDAPDVCATAANPRDCTFRINRNISTYLGLGWGFASSDKTTVGVRVDITYWLLSLDNAEDQPAGSPLSSEVPRPQDSWSILIGFEFMRWP